MSGKYDDCHLVPEGSELNVGRVHVLILRVLILKSDLWTRVGVGRSLRPEGELVGSFVVGDQESGKRYHSIPILLEYLSNRSLETVLACGRVVDSQ